MRTNYHYGILNRTSEIVVMKDSIVPNSAME